MDRLNKAISDVAYIHRDCGYMPKAGQMVRYNCPFYKAESEGT